MLSTASSYTPTPQQASWPRDESRALRTTAAETGDHGPCGKAHRQCYLVPPSASTGIVRVWEEHLTAPEPATESEYLWMRTQRLAISVATNMLHGMESA